LAARCADIIPRALTPARSASPARALSIALLAALGIALLVAPVALADVFTPESGGSPNADKIDSLYKIILYVAIVIFLLVEGTLLWSLIKYRARRRGPEAAQIHGNTPLEVGWTIGAATILVVLTVVTFVYLDDIQNPPASGPGGLASGVEVAAIDQQAPPQGDSKPLTIDVNGQQYLWRYDYPGNEVFSYYELVVPVNTTVVLRLHASDVIHSWWIPKLGGKMDAVPGYTNKTWFKISEPGTYRGQCAELCGAGHADMRAVVRAVQPEQYTDFLEQQAQDIEAAQEGLASQREQRQQDEIQ
jgi:cytochrome c oxidase subunit 2